jgi:co-chaperonin GroES (HSP10)
MPFMVMEHDVDPAEKLRKEVGDISGFDIYNNQVLVATYMRPQKTKSGIYLPDSTTAEDQFQSKVGLVLKTGPDAFVDEDNKWFRDVNVSVGDWIVFRPSDGWNITVNNIACRILDDTAVRGKVDKPDRVW